jgi:O-antigen/teichoic acid export membrane protein
VEARDALSRAIARNAVLKLAAHGTRGLSLAFLILAARALGPDDFGRLTFAYALAALLAAALDLGMHPVLIRGMVREPEATARHWMAGATLKLGLLVPAGLAVAAAPLAVRSEPATVHAVWLLALASVFQAFTELSISVFAAYGRFELDVAVRVVEKTLLLGLGVLVLALDAGVVAVAAVFAVSSAVALAGSVVVVSRGFTRVPRAIDVPRARAFARRLGPVALASLCDLAKTRVIAPLVFVIAGEAAAGYFGAAVRVLDLLIVLPAAVVAAAYPALARLGAADPAFRALAREVLAVLIALGLAVALVLHAGAAPLTRLAFGTAYAPAAPLLGLLGVAACLAFANSFLSAVLLALDRPRRLVTVSAIGFASALVVTPMLVAQAGAVGGSLALLVLEAITLGVSLVALVPLVGSPVGRDAAKMLAAALVAGLLATLVPGAGALRAGLVLALYAAGLLVLRPACATRVIELARAASGRRSATAPR